MDHDDGHIFESTSESVEQTIELGFKLGQAMQGGEIVALSGNLGAGKTHFIKGLASGLEVWNADEVTSPTFTLINEYEGRYQLYHIDAYRLESSQQLEGLGFDEFCCGPTVVVVEWADKVPDILKDYQAIWVFINHLGETSRGILIKNLPGHLWEALCTGL